LRKPRDLIRKDFVHISMKELFLVVVGNRKLINFFDNPSRIKGLAKFIRVVGPKADMIWAQGFKRRSYNGQPASVSRRVEKHIFKPRLEIVKQTKFFGFVN